MTEPTIYALATPPGRGAVAVIRVSGVDTPRAFDHFGFPPPLPRTATLVHLKTLAGDTIDHGLVTFFPAPRSYTGEDVLELSLHGGRAVVQGVMGALSHLPGFRLAEPGEFTKRAFLNGKLDLTEAEAVADLIDAETALQRRQALSQLSGRLSALYAEWANDLKRALAYVEAHLDFPDEDLPADLLTKTLPTLEKLGARVGDHLNDARRGERLREGVQIVILGAPNAGKSSLLNALAARDVAIVSDVAGTTRDIIDVHLDIGGYPVTLTDTAGLRDLSEASGGHNAIEAEGIRRALARAEAADLKIVLIDATTLPAIDAHTRGLMDDRALIVLNKSDLARNLPTSIEGHPALPLSAHTGAGVDALFAALQEKLGPLANVGEAPTLTRARHREALHVCHAALMRAKACDAPELLAEELRAALAALGRITGKVDVEDLLDVIFRDFCIGK